MYCLFTDSNQIICCVLHDMGSSVNIILSCSFVTSNYKIKLWTVLWK
ncbi:hypothetical protein X975_25445, partial [Stegodyphus mimosarum]